MPPLARVGQNLVFITDGFKDVFIFSGESQMKISNTLKGVGCLVVGTVTVGILLDHAIFRYVMIVAGFYLIATGIKMIFHKEKPEKIPQQ